MDVWCIYYYLQVAQRNEWLCWSALNRLHWRIIVSNDEAVDCIHLPVFMMYHPKAALHSNHILYTLQYVFNILPMRGYHYPSSSILQPTFSKLYHPLAWMSPRLWLDLELKVRLMVSSPLFRLSVPDARKICVSFPCAPSPAERWRLLWEELSLLPLNSSKCCCNFHPKFGASEKNNGRSRGWLYNSVVYQVPWHCVRVQYTHNTNGRNAVHDVCIIRSSVQCDRQELCAELVCVCSFIFIPFANIMCCSFGVHSWLCIRT